MLSRLYLSFFHTVTSLSLQNRLTPQQSHLTSAIATSIQSVVDLSQLSQINTIASFQGIIKLIVLRIKESLSSLEKSGGTTEAS
jgi:hypothetical protein